MSTDVTPTTTVTLDTTELLTKEATEIVANSSSNSVTQLSNKDILAVKKEYSIVGDAFYAGINTDAAPSWLTDLINNVVDTSVSAGLSDYDQLVQDVRNAIDSIDVAANTYVEQINFSGDVDSIIGTHLDTLNATIDGKFATIVNLDIVKADTESALAVQASDLRAEFSDDINARITQVNTAFANGDSANADSITALTVVFNSQGSALAATADAVTGLQTFVGLAPDDDNPGVISESQWFVDLENEVTGPTGHVATSLNALEISSKSYADASSVSVENKFAFDSTIIMDGLIYDAGFGLDITGVSQVGKDGLTEATRFNSKFRVNAETFVLTSPAFPGVEAKFAIDANGLVIETPEITVGSLNGNVISASTALKAGSGTNISVMSGADALYRIWVGAVAGADADFSVDKTGKVKAEAGSIGGWSITSRYMYSGANTTLSGKYAASGVILDSSDAIRTPYFYSDSTGAGFKGTVQAEKIVGDVTDLKAKVTAAQTSSFDGDGRTVLNFSVSSMPFNRTIVVSGLVTELEPVTLTSIGKVGGTFRLFQDSTEVDTFSMKAIAAYPDGNVIAQSRPLVVAIASGVSGSYSVTIEKNLGYSFIHAAQKVLIQVFKDGETIT